MTLKRLRWKGRGREFRRLDPVARSRLRSLETEPDLTHRLLDDADVLLRRQPPQGLVAGQFDIGRQPVGIEARLLHQPRLGLGDQLQMDIAAEVVVDAQLLRDQNELLHRIVAGADDARGEKQALDIVPLVEIEREVDDLVDAEPRALDVRGRPVDAIDAVVDAEIGQQDLEQGHAPAVRGVGVTDAHALGRADALAADRVPFRRPRRGAGGIVFGGVRQDGELLAQIENGHPFTLCSLSPGCERGRERKAGSVQIVEERDLPELTDHLRRRLDGDLGKLQVGDGLGHVGVGPV